ncbi:glycosyltransferase family 2 protein [Candidatus Woesearchaeota archaeon]|nr:glycosyltransferase family 2 protein [Candidatus Woesearchaeota archaeon]
MTDYIMVIGAVLFFGLFVYLSFILLLTLLSVFVKDKHEKFDGSVSILIPCYNESEVIVDTLRSIKQQGYKGKLEVIVIDDGSTDDTQKSVEEFSMREKFAVKIIHGKHQGKSKALNDGVKAAKNDFILTIDADTMLEKGSLQKLIAPFKDAKVGATNGSMVVAKADTLIRIFQRIEYHYNNLIRKSFSKIYKNSIWFYGAFACYRKNALKKIGSFHTDTMTEDMDSSMLICKEGYRAVNVYSAIASTNVPTSISRLIKQRMRWWIGGMQVVWKHRNLFSSKSSAAVNFFFINQYWWSLYALMLFPILIYQIFYWLPFNLGSVADTFWYLFRWFTLSGPIYVIYKIPEWGISLYGIFGVLGGLISAFLIIWAIIVFKDKFDLKNIIAIFLYFPYTLILNMIIVISLVRLLFLKRSYFIE